MFKKPNRGVNRVFLHCSATSNKSITVKDIDRWHRDRGFSEVGYHFFVRTDGTLETGRSLEKTPAAQSGHNTGTIAICLNGLKLTDFTEAQFDTLRDLCEQINDAYGGNITFWMHNEVSVKSCPVFDATTVLGLNGRRLTGKYPKNELDAPRAARCTIPETQVKAYQLFKGLVPDGIIGPNTWRELTK